MERYQIETFVDDKPVIVRCGEATAKALLPLWAEAEPNATVCRDLVLGRTITAFSDDLGRVLTFGINDPVTIEGELAK